MSLAYTKHVIKRKTELETAIKSYEKFLEVCSSRDSAIEISVHSSPTTYSCTVDVNNATPIIEAVKASLYYAKRELDKIDSKIESIATLLGRK